MENLNLNQTFKQKDFDRTQEKTKELLSKKVSTTGFWQKYGFLAITPVALIVFIIPPPGISRATASFFFFSCLAYTAYRLFTKSEWRKKLFHVFGTLVLFFLIFNGLLEGLGGLGIIQSPLMIPFLAAPAMLATFLLVALVRKYVGKSKIS